jgi:hypothetical protein
MTRRIPWLKVIPVVLVVGFGANWVSGQRSDRLAEAAEIVAEAEELEAKIPAARAAQAKVEEAERTIAAVSTAIPASSELQGLITTLSTLASAANVEWQTARFGSPPAPGPDGDAAAAGPGATAQELSLELNATEATLRGYLDTLAKMPRLLVVDAVQISWGAPKPYTIRASLSVRAFTMPPLMPTATTGATSTTATPATSAPAKG